MRRYFFSRNPSLTLSVLPHTYPHILVRHTCNRFRIYKSFLPIFDAHTRNGRKRSLRKDERRTHANQWFHTHVSVIILVAWPAAAERGCRHVSRFESSWTLPFEKKTWLSNFLLCFHVAVSLSLRLCVCLNVWLSICLSVCLSVSLCLSLSLSLFLSLSPSLSPSPLHLTFLFNQVQSRLWELGSKLSAKQPHRSTCPKENVAFKKQEQRRWLWCKWDFRNNECKWEIIKRLDSGIEAIGVYPSALLVNYYRPTDRLADRGGSYTQR